MCRTPGCTIRFRPERGLLNFRFCRQCTFARKKEKRYRHKLSKKPYPAYPHARFQHTRKQLSLFGEEKKCGVCGITAKKHRDKYGIDLHLDHIIPARFVKMIEGDPHDPRNLMWLCKFDHGRRRRAEERLKSKEGLRGFILQMEMEGADMQRVKSLLQFYGVATDKLPF